MKAIVIDSKLQNVHEVDIDGKLESLQSAVGGYIELVELGGAEDLYVNEEGLINGTQEFFIFSGAHQPFAGNGIIIGSDGEGGQVSTLLTVEYVKSKVKFVSAVEALESIEK